VNYYGLICAPTVEQASGRLKARATPDVEGFCE